MKMGKSKNRKKIVNRSHIDTGFVNGDADGKDTFKPANMLKVKPLASKPFKPTSPVLKKEVKHKEPSTVRHYNPDSSLAFPHKGLSKAIEEFAELINVLCAPTWKSDRSFLIAELADAKAIINYLKLYTFTQEMREVFDTHIKRNSPSFTNKGNYMVHLTIERLSNGIHAISKLISLDHVELRDCRTVLLNNAIRSMADVHLHLVHLIGNSLTESEQPEAFARIKEKEQLYCLWSSVCAECTYALTDGYKVYKGCLHPVMPKDQVEENPRHIGSCPFKERYNGNIVEHSQFISEFL